MRAEKVIKELLNANSAISAIVGSRIWGGVAEEQAPSPLIVYRKLGAERGDTLDREEGNEVFAIMEIIVASLDYSQMKDLGEAVRLALTYYESINVTIAGVSVLGIKTAGEGETDMTQRAANTFRIGNLKFITLNKFWLLLPGATETLLIRR